MMATAAAAAYPPERIADSVAFIDEILAELQAAAPDVGKKFVKLLSRFGKHGGDADADAVVSRAADLLRGHPGVLRRFTAQVHMDIVPDALAFGKRVHDTAGPVVHDRFLAVLDEAKRREDMAADEIYDRAKRAFGPAHVALLHTFANMWFPVEHEWKLQQQQQARRPAARQRSRAAAASAHAGVPVAKKPRRADDDGNTRRHDPAAIAPRRQRSRVAVASSHAAAGMRPDAKKPHADDGNNGRRHDHVIAVAVLEVRNVKKRRIGDDGTARGLQALHRIGDYDDYAPRSRAKKHHSGNGKFSGSATAARVLGANAAGVLNAYSGDNDKKPQRRRTANGDKGSFSTGAAAGLEWQQQERDDEVRRFRQEWVFQTYYSKLVATSDRVAELLCRYRRTPHSDSGGDGVSRGNRSLEALLPLPECREFLGNCYGDRWGEMRAALERGESRVPALEAIARRLTAKEEEAVVEESRKRCRHDPGRVAQRLHGLAVDYTLDEECRRRCMNDTRELWLANGHDH